MLLRCYVIDIVNKMESLKRHFMSCGNCDELEQTLQERQHRKLRQKKKYRHQYDNIGKLCETNISSQLQHPLQQQICGLYRKTVAII
jgi:translation initiation factor 2 beta subunit (eIF-2beta)/eIF-5